MNRRLPVTLVGGFLGAGKTSLLHHFISEHKGGHLALFLDAPGLLNLDAKAVKGLCGAMRRDQDFVAEIPPGNEKEQLKWLEACLHECVTAGRYERVLIELGGVTDMAEWGRYFVTDSSEFPGISAGVELQQIICVVDALDFYRTVVLPADGRLPGGLLNFQQKQVAGSTLLILNKCDLVDDAQRTECTRRLRAMNAHAQIVETDYGEVPLELMTRPAGAGSGSARKEPVTPMEDEKAWPGLAASLFRAYRPFHPERFWEWFNAEHQGLLRVKGLIWLATRNLLVGGVSRTRWQNGCGAAGIWWAALPREEWPTETAALARMQETWREPYGDRRQELVLVGDEERLKIAGRELEQCLLTDEEFARPVGEWTGFSDPFPVWDLEE